MIDLNLGKFSIRTLDKHNTVLIEHKVVENERFASCGTEIEKRIGYYPDLQSALKAYCRQMLQNGEEVLSTAQDILNKIEELEALIQEVVGSLKVDSNSPEPTVAEDVADKE